MLASAAEHCREQAIAVILTGALEDGGRGAAAVAATGGVVIVQDRASSMCFSMPRAALARRAVHHVMPLRHIAHALCALIAPGARPWFDVRGGSAYLLWQLGSQGELATG
jgi:two-component system chemotaxis response regulator CheB